MNSESNGGETITSNESKGGEKLKPPNKIINKDKQKGSPSTTQNIEHTPTKRRRPQIKGTVKNPYISPKKKSPNRYKG